MFTIIKRYFIKNIILDIETNGLNHKKNNILQVAYNICDHNFNILNEQNLFINNSNEKNIIDLLYKDIYECNNIYGHNIDFDMRFIEYKFNYYGYKHKNINKIDTMKISKDIVKCRNKLGNIKYPKLKELYEYYYPNTIDEKKLHTADYDVFLTRLICKKII